jgi:hypothetical protein
MTSPGQRCDEIIRLIDEALAATAADEQQTSHRPSAGTGSRGRPTLGFHPGRG